MNRGIKCRVRLKLQCYPSVPLCRSAGHAYDVLPALLPVLTIFFVYERHFSVFKRAAGSKCVGTRGSEDAWLASRPITVLGHRSVCSLASKNVREEAQVAALPQ